MKMKIDFEYGLRHSPYPDRNSLTLKLSESIKPFDLLNELQQTVTQLEHYPLHFPRSEWWGHVNPCPRCRQRFQERFNVVTPHNAWKEAYCLRHGVLFAPQWDIYYALSLEFSDCSVAYCATSARHKLSVILNIDEAIITLSVFNVYTKELEKQFTFKYSNHANSYPFLSSYKVILNNIVNALQQLVDEIRTPAEKRWGHLYIETPERTFKFPVKRKT